MHVLLSSGMRRGDHWNTRYQERALKQPVHLGPEVHPADVERVWPLGFQHVNLLGRYSFDLAEPLTRGELRSLREAQDCRYKSLRVRV